MGDYNNLSDHMYYYHKTILTSSELEDIINLVHKYHPAQIKICTGCNRRSDYPVDKKYIACCPDNNYIPLDDFLEIGTTGPARPESKTPEKKEAHTESSATETLHELFEKTLSQTPVILNKGTQEFIGRREVVEYFESLLSPKTYQAIIGAKEPTVMLMSESMHKKLSEHIKDETRGVIIVEPNFDQPKRNEQGYPLLPNGDIDWKLTSKEKSEIEEKHQYRNRDGSPAKKPKRKYPSNYTPPKKRHRKSK